jgi:hypothetical protein
MSLYELSVPQLKKMLTNLERWLDAGIAYAEKKKFEPAVLLASRLAPDQFSLLKQVQGACDQAKFCAARLAGKDPPKHADTEQTFDELRARIQNVRAYLDTFQPADFQGVEDELLVLPMLGQGKGIRGKNYLAEFLLPNFYFHITTAYSILRHNGVELGKRDFLGAVTLEDT